MTRAEQVEHNRERVLAAARKVFLDKGFYAASLDGIAEEAGFSKGVVYSQFDSKADLMMSLLERRIAELAHAQWQLAQKLESVDDFAEITNAMARAVLAEPRWTLLVIEFRVIAARDAALNARYAEAHKQTIKGVADAICLLHERSGVAPPAPFEDLAVALIALFNGVVLENAATAKFSLDLLTETIGRIVGVRQPSVRGEKP